MSKIEKRTALFIGHTGSGKTSICAGLTRDRLKFKPNDSLESAVADPVTAILVLKAKECKEGWIPVDTRFEITIVDAPGFNDTHKLSDLEIVKRCLYEIEARTHNLTSLFLCFSYSKIGDAELKGVEALLERFKGTKMASITTILLTHAETLTRHTIEQKKQNLGRLGPLAQLCGARVEFVGFPFQAEYDLEIHRELKQFHEDSVERFRGHLLKKICDPPRHELMWIDLRNVVDQEKKDDRLRTVSAVAAVGIVAVGASFKLFFK